MGFTVCGGGCRWEGNNQSCCVVPETLKQPLLQIALTTDTCNLQLLRCHLNIVKETHLNQPEAGNTL